MGVLGKNYVAYWKEEEKRKKRGELRAARVWEERGGEGFGEGLFGRGIKVNLFYIKITIDIKEVENGGICLVFNFISYSCCTLLDRKFFLPLFKR